MGSTEHLTARCHNCSNRQSAATIIKNIGLPRHELDDHANVIRPIRALSRFSRGLAG
jgi:hypothetical protein